MLRAKTVLVLGAGASFEVGLPLGKRLLEQIAELVTYQFEFGNAVHGDDIILRALRLRLNEGSDVTKLNEHLKSAGQLVASAPQAKSIDTIIDTLEDERIELVGKLGIARAILGAEGSSEFFSTPDHRPTQFDLRRFDKTWYAPFSGVLYDGRRKSDVANVFENLEIINFNYDRCLETYLGHSLSAFYGLSLAEAQSVVQTLVMHRPYGSLGKLPWYGGSGPHIPFGECGPTQVEQAAQQIRTFTERVEEGAGLQAIRAAIAGADRVVLLGFGFHRPNIDLLGTVVQKHCEILGTTSGIAADASHVIEEELKMAFGISEARYEREFNLVPYKCLRFLDDFGRRLTAGPAD
jgi:hypothetical protein